MKQVRREDNNVIAVLPPSVPTDNPEYVMIGAHYDHSVTMTARSSPRVEIWLIHNGADDNTSGSVLLELAWMAEARKHNPEIQTRCDLLLVDGEELGLLGSAQYAKIH